MLFLCVCVYINPFVDDTILQLNQTDNKDREPSKVIPIKHPKMKNLRQEQLRRMKQQNKETELNGNPSNSNNNDNQETDQDAKRTESSTKKNMKNFLNKQDMNDSGGSGASNDMNDEIPKEKPRHDDRNKFAIEMNEGGAYVPEPYQYVPTFDDKLLEREYKVIFILTIL